MGAYPYLDNLKMTYGDSTDSSGDFLTVSYSTIPLIPNISDSTQLEVVWFSPALFDENGAAIPTTSLAADDIFSTGVIPSSTYVVDDVAKTITIDQQAVQDAQYVASDGTVLYRAKVVPSDSNLLTVQRSTPIGSRLVEFAPGSRITPGQLNLSDDQLFYKIQELTKQADDLFGIATVTGIIDDGEEVTNLSELTDVTLTPLSNGDALYWTGAFWTNGGIPLSALSDVTDVLSPSVGHVLTYNGSEWIAAAPTGDGNVYVNEVNGKSGVVNLTMADLPNDAGYLTSATLPTNISEYTNDSGYVTATTAPVTSVNDQVGDVVIDIPTEIDDLDDVDTALRANGDALRWDSTAGKWKPGGSPVTTPNTVPVPSIFTTKPDGVVNDFYYERLQNSPMHNGGIANGTRLDLGYREFVQGYSTGSGASFSWIIEPGYYPVYRVAIDMPGHLNDPHQYDLYTLSKVDDLWAEISGITEYNTKALVVNQWSYDSQAMTLQAADLQESQFINAPNPLFASAGVGTGQSWQDYLLAWDGVSAYEHNCYAENMYLRPPSDSDGDGEDEYGDFAFTGPYGALFPNRPQTYSPSRYYTLGDIEYFPVNIAPKGTINTDGLADPSTITEDWWQTGLITGNLVQKYPMYTSREYYYRRTVIDFCDCTVEPTDSP